MRGDAHHRPRIRQVEQRLIERNAIFLRIFGGDGRGCLLGERGPDEQGETRETQRNPDDFVVHLGLGLRVTV